MVSGINAHAQTGFAKSAKYDQHRPSYPASSVQELLEQCRVAGKQGARIVDLAAGTGKFTELLAARDERFEIIAVEPHGGMREVLEGKKLPRTTVLDGKGDSMPIEDASVDAVIVAQVGVCPFPPSPSGPMCCSKTILCISYMTTALVLLAKPLPGFPLVRPKIIARRDPPRP